MILDAVRSPQLHVCLDTCHVWDAGYDIAGSLEGVLEEFDRVIGLAHLRAIHMNDSKNPLARVRTATPAWERAASAWKP